MGTDINTRQLRAVISHAINNYSFHSVLVRGGAKLADNDDYFSPCWCD